MKDLPPSIPRFTYLGESQFLEILESELTRFKSSTTVSEFLLFQASKETIETIFNPQNEDTSLARNFNSFDTNEQLLLAKISLEPHGVAADIINTKIRAALISIGLDHSVKGYPGMKFRGSDRGKVVDYS